jgi:hypothetical protein
MHAVAGFIAANTTTRTLTKDRKRRPCSFSVLQSQKFFIAATTGAGQSLSQTERFNSERTDCGPSVDPSAGSFLQDPMPLLTNYDSMKMSNNIDQFWYVEKLATLTQLYLELRLPLHDALRAAEADL